MRMLAGRRWWCTHICWRRRSSSSRNRHAHHYQLAEVVLCSAHIQSWFHTYTHASPARRIIASAAILLLHSFGGVDGVSLIQSLWWLPLFPSASRPVSPRGGVYVWCVCVNWCMCVYVFRNHNPTLLNWANLSGWDCVRDLKSWLIRSILQPLPVWTWQPLVLSTQNENGKSHEVNVCACACLELRVKDEREQNKKDFFIPDQKVQILAKVYCLITIPAYHVGTPQLKCWESGKDFIEALSPYR